MANNLPPAPYTSRFLAGNLLHQRQWAQAGWILAGLCLALLAGLMCFWGLNHYPLRDNNEGLYAEIAREMLASGNYVIPHLDGVPYIEKPPLLYWLIALSYSLFGVSTGSARLVPALSLYLTCLYLVYLGIRLGYARLGGLAALLLSTSLPLVFLSRTVLFDSLLTALMTVALLQFFRWSLAPRRGLLLAAYGFVGLAVLTKGLVALALTGGPAVLYLLLQPQRRTLLRAFFDLRVLALLLVITLPWHLAASLAQPHFAWFYFINEHVLRFLGKREPHDYHSGPFYYYLWRVPVSLLPWTPFVLLLLRRPPTGMPAVQQRLEAFCATWFLFTLAFFSLSSAKADYYMMIAMPALVLLIASRLACLVRTRQVQPLLLPAGLLVLPALLLLAIASTQAGPAWMIRHGLPAGLQRELLLGLACTVVVLLAAWWCLRRQRPLAALAAIALSAIPVLLFALTAFQAAAGRTSCDEIARFIRQHHLEGTPIFVFQQYEDVYSTLRFFSAQPLWIVDSTSSDLQFGCRVARQDHPCLSLRAFRDYARHHPVLLLVTEERLPRFRAAYGPPPTKLQQRFGDKWLFSNQ